MKLLEGVCLSSRIVRCALIQLAIISGCVWVLGGSGFYFLPVPVAWAVWALYLERAKKGAWIGTVLPFTIGWLIFFGILVFFLSFVYGRGTPNTSFDSLLQSQRNSMGPVHF